MSERRIEKWFDGTLRPTFSETPRFSSARVPWSGFLMERDPCLAGRAESIAFPHTELIMVIGGGVCIEDQAFGVRRRFFAGPGSVTIWPAGHESRSIAWQPSEPRTGTTDILSMQLDPAALRLLTPEDSALPITMQAASDDPVLGSLLQLAETDIQAGGACGRLYGESLCLALASRVQALYAGTGPQRASSKDELTPKQRDRLRDHVDSHLDSDLSLPELARVCALSPQRFGRAFRHSFGTTPHQYVLAERIKRAKRLLATQTLSIADVAFSVGFASQSHFTEAFRKAVEMTPRRYREAAC